MKQWQQAFRLSPPLVGFLPELIADQVTGRLMDISGQDLAKILEELIRDEVNLHEMGQRSIKTAVLRFSPMLQAEKTLNFYHKLLKGLM